jgi:hypothetical protein
MSCSNIGSRNYLVAAVGMTAHLRARQCFGADPINDQRLPIRPASVADHGVAPQSLPRAILILSRIGLPQRQFPYATAWFHIARS